MVSPTLFEVAVIIELWSMGKVILLNMMPTNKYRVIMSQIAYSAFIKNMGMPRSAISDYEHVTFLLYWLNTIVFCSKSVKAQTRYLSLAALLHEGKKLHLSSYFLPVYMKNLAPLSTKLEKGNLSTLAALLSCYSCGSMPFSNLTTTFISS